MSELIEDIRKPISEVAHCGEDVKYDDDYGALQAEINKTAENDWEMVVELGRTILAQKSKDLNVATWLCIGLLQLQGFDGLADGLEGYLILLQEYWDGLYPQRERARVSALRMLSSKLGGDASTMGLIEARQATDSDANALQRILQTVKVLNTEIQDKCPDSALSLKNIADAAEDKLTSIGALLEGTTTEPSAGVSQPATEQPGAPADTKPSVDEKQEVSPSEVPAETTTETVQKQVTELPKLTAEEVPTVEKVMQEETPAKKELQPTTTPQRAVEQTQPTNEATTPTPSEWKTRMEAIDTIIQVASFLRSENPQDVVPYRLLRSVRWDIWQELPSDWRNNRSLLLLPQIEVKSNLDALVKSENFQDLLTQSEELFAEGNCHFWLDLQRYINTALKGLGADYDAVRKAILREIAMFVDRLPTIIEFSYRDGTEFADEETKAWIKQEVRPTLSIESGAAKQDIEETSSAQADISSEQKPSPPEVTTSRSDVAPVSSANQQIEVGGDGAKVEISIKIFTK